jgi:hypothetical protein
MNEENIRKIGLRTPIWNAVFQPSFVCENVQSVNALPFHDMTRTVRFAAPGRSWLNAHWINPRPLTETWIKGCVQVTTDHHLQRVTVTIQLRHSPQLLAKFILTSPCAQPSGKVSMDGL